MLKLAYLGFGFPLSLCNMQSEETMHTNLTRVLQTYSYVIALTQHNMGVIIMRIQNFLKMALQIFYEEDNNYQIKKKKDSSLRELNNLSRIRSLNILKFNADKL